MQCQCYNTNTESWLSENKKQNKQTNLRFKIKELWNGTGSQSVYHSSIETHFRIDLLGIKMQMAYKTAGKRRHKFGLILTKCRHPFFQHSSVCGQSKNLIFYIITACHQKLIAIFHLRKENQFVIYCSLIRDTCE